MDSVVQILRMIVEHENSLLLQLMDDEDEDCKLLQEILAAPLLSTSTSTPDLSANVNKSIWKILSAEEEEETSSDDLFKETFRMEKSNFNLLVQELLNDNNNELSNNQEISIEDQVAIALYTLGSTSDHETVGTKLGVSSATIGEILHDFCLKVISQLAAEFLAPKFITQEKIDECVEGFEQLGMPQCFGLLDSCHIEIKPKSIEIADYFNNESWYSVVLMAVVDYRFVYLNVGAPGRCHDSLIYEQSDLNAGKSELFHENAKFMNGTKVPVFLLADSAHQLGPTVMKPFPESKVEKAEEEIFNFAAARTRRVIDGAFKQLKARFRRIDSGLDNRTESSTNIIICCCILHNFLNERGSKVPDKWLKALTYRRQPQYSNTSKDNRRHSADGNGQAEKIRTAVASFITDKLRT